MLATHCDKCGKVLMLDRNGSLNMQLTEAGWVKLINYTSADETEIDLCKECFDNLQTALRKED